MKKYFVNPKNLTHRHFEALRAHYVEGVSLSDLAKKYRLSLSYLRSTKNKYCKLLKLGIDPFFQDKKPGPKNRHKVDTMREQIISLRKQNFSVLDIKAALEACGQKISHPTIAQVLKEEGFVRLSRRSFQEKNQLIVPIKMQPPRSNELVVQKEEFSTGRSGGVLSFLPLIEELGIIDAIQKAGYPETSEISSVSYILSFLALKLIGNKRFSHDESWALDRVLGLFAGLNVLPKSSSLSSYSYRVSRSCNRNFLLEMSRIFSSTEEMCEFNLDFKSIPHWGDESFLEKNYSTIRGKAVKSVLSLIVQNVTTERLEYTNAEITHEAERDAVLEFVDFWKEGHDTAPKMLIFDSQFTIYENLSKLNRDNIKFLTLRGRRAVMKAHAKSIPEDQWQVVEVEAAKRKRRKVKVYSETIKLRKYQGLIRQLIVIDQSKEPIFMLTNDFESSPAALIRKYGRRWLVEQEIAEQIAFFNLNQLSSSVVVKVDFDLTITLLAHNLYRHLASHIDRHEKATVNTLHRRFIENRAMVKKTKTAVSVSLGKRSHAPLLFETPWMNKTTNLSWHGFKIHFSIGTSS